MNLVIKNFSLYASASFINRVISLFSVSYVLFSLGTQELGFLSLVNNFIAFVATVIGCGLRQVLGIEFYHSDSSQRMELINDIIVVYCAVAIPSLLFIIGLKKYFFLSNNLAPLFFYIALLHAFLFFFSELFLQLLTYHKCAFYYGFLQIFSSLCVVIISGILIFKQWGIAGVIIGNFAGIIVLNICALYTYKKLEFNKFLSGKRTFKKLFFYIQSGMPFLPALMSNLVLLSANRWVLAYFQPLSEVGIYSIIESLNACFTLFILNSLGNAYVPELLEQFSHNRANFLEVDRENKKYMWICMLGGFFVLMIFFCVMYWAPSSLVPSKIKNIIFLALISLSGHIFLMGTYFSSCIIQFLKYTWFLSSTLMVCAIATCCMSIVFVSYFGIYGAVYASCFSYGIYFFIILFYNTLLHNKVRVP